MFISLVCVNVNTYYVVLVYAGVYMDG